VATVGHIGAALRLNPGGDVTLCESFAKAMSTPAT
jgi:hypothetical protein